MNGSHYNNQTSTSASPDPFNEAEKVSFTIAYLIVFLVAILGNSFVIHVAHKMLAAGRGPFNILVISMAASDILYAVTTATLEIKYLHVELWIPGGFGTFFCKFSLFAIVFTISSSILTLTAMTVDRYLAIVPRVKKPLTRRKIIKVIVAILGISCVYSSIPLLKMDTVSKYINNVSRTYCKLVYSGNIDTDAILIKADYMSSFVLLYVFPVLTMSVMYVCIIRFLWLRKIPGNRTEQNETQRRKQLKRVTLMLVTMASTFAITWLPMHVIHYYRATYGTEWRWPAFLVALFFWSAHTNCATNPCFYLVFNKEYRDELRRLWPGKLRKIVNDEVVVLGAYKHSHLNNIVVSLRSCMDRENRAQQIIEH